MPVQLLPSFNAGELSPRLESRPDLDKYSSGCRTLENFLIMPYGGVNRRPGLVYMGAAKYANKQCRLVGFNFSTTTNFILEFGNLYIRFWSNGQQVQSAGNPYEIASPYLEADLFAFQFVQINDVMYITHPSYPVHKLSRLGDANWTIAPVAWEYPPMRDENVTATTITPSATTGTGITLTASAAVFDANDVGGYYEITHKRTTATVSTIINVVNDGTAMRVVGAWDFHTTGTWSGTVTIQRSTDNVTWEVARTFTAAADRNISTSGVEEKEVWMRVSVTAYTSGGGTGYLDATDSTVYGVVKITAVTDSTHATANVIHDMAATTATAFWSEGAWSARRGYPRTCCLHEQRLWFGGCAAQAQTVWGSAVNDFETFRRLTYDDSPVTFTIASQETNAINWMTSQKVLQVGTAGYEYIVSSSDANSPITPTNISVKAQSHFGSFYAPALLANEVTLFVQRQGRKVREFVYQFSSDSYVSADLTLLADHVTAGGIKQVAFQQQPDAILWTVTGAGILAGMTYERGQNVEGWHRHTTQGTFESVASIYGGNVDTASGGSDEVWCVVNRSINGNTVRYIERFDPLFRETLEAEDKTGWLYLDSATRYNGSATTQITGLEHLEGKTVDVLADGAVANSKVVSSGKITLDSAASVVTVGLGYTSTLVPMPLDPGALPDGSAQGRFFRVNRLVVRIYKSLGGELQVQESPEIWDPISFRDTASPMNDSPPVFTGDKERMIARGYEKKATVRVRQTQPLPLTILGVVPKYDVLGD